MSMLTRLKLKRKDLVPDLVAGATFAIVNVPQGMANAVLATVNPMAGLYALIIAMPVGAVFTSSVFMNVSTTGALSVAAGEALEKFDGEEKISALITLVLMIGAVQLFFGLLGLGRLMRFVSNAVMTGFITGIAFLIIFGSIPDLTGYESAQPNHLLRLADTALNWRALDPTTLIVGLATVGMILAVQKTPVSKFALAVGLGASTILGMALSGMMDQGALVLVQDVATIERSLPMPMLPNLAQLPDFLLPAFAIAVIGLVQGAGVGQSFPNPDGRFPDTSKDFVGQGAANLAGGFFGGIPCGGSMSGTAVTVQAGGRSRWTNIFAGLFVLLIVFALADLVKLVPMAGLGGLLLVVGIQNIQPAAVRTVWDTGVPARSAMVVTFLATLFLPLQFAIIIGVGISFLLQILRSANQVEVLELVVVPNGFPVERPAPEALGSNEVHVLRIRGAMFFASARVIEDQMPSVGEATGATVILVLRDVDDLGSTIIRLLKLYASELKRNGGKLVITGANESLMGQLDRTGLTDALGRENIYPARPELFAALNEALEAASGRPNAPNA